jgi:hypothetical protein
MWLRNFILILAVMSSLIAFGQALCPSELSDQDPFGNFWLDHSIPGDTKVKIYSPLASGTYLDVQLIGNCGSASSWTAQVIDECDANAFCNLTVPIPSIDVIPRADAPLCGIIASYCAGGGTVLYCPISIVDRQISSNSTSVTIYTYSPFTASSNSSIVLHDLTSNNIVQGGLGENFMCIEQGNVLIIPDFNTGFWALKCTCIAENPNCFEPVLSSVPWSVVQTNGHNYARSPNDPGPIAEPVSEPVSVPIVPPTTPPLSPP